MAASSAKRVQPTPEQQRTGAYVVAFICKSILLCYGIGLLMPWETFAASPVAYRVFIASGVPEPVWGLGYAVLGGVGLWSLRRAAPARLRLWLGVAGSMVYLGMTISFLIANPVSQAVWLYGPLALFDFFSLPYLAMPGDE